MLQSMPYLGSKAASGAYQAICALMPPHDTYIEPFVGSGAVLLRKPPASQSFAVDLDPEAIANLTMPARGKKLCADAFKFLSRFDYAGSGRVLVYADPPYLWSTRTSRSKYRFDFGRANHIRLLKLLAELPASVILSGYPAPLYDESLPTWRTREFQVMTRGGPRTEKLWYNFEPKASHWSSYAGSTFTERQRIKRKAERWANNFAKMPPLERQAVFAAMLEHD
jgi:site-specific DNA-adenine methylase